MPSKPVESSQTPLIRHPRKVSQLSASTSEQNRKVSIEPISNRKNPPHSSTSTKENREKVCDRNNSIKASSSTTRPDVFERLGPMSTPDMNAKRFKVDTSNNSERSHGWEGMGEKERSWYQPKQSQGYQSGYKARDKQSESREYRINAEKSGKRPSWTTKSSNEQIFPEYNYELYSGEARAPKSNHRPKVDKQDRHNQESKISETSASSSGQRVAKLNNSSGSDNKVNRDYASKNAEKNKTKSHLTVSKIQILDATLPKDPPKIILKRKEIRISPPESKSSEPRYNNRSAPTTQPPEPEEFEMINESQDLPAVGDETVTEAPTPRFQPITTPDAIEPQTRREPTGELMEEGSVQENIQAMSDLSTKNEDEEPQTRREPTGELMEDGNAQAPIQAMHIQESVIKISVSSEYHQRKSRYIWNFRSHQVKLQPPLKNEYLNRSWRTWMMFRTSSCRQQHPTRTT